MITDKKLDQILENQNLIISLLKNGSAAQSAGSEKKNSIWLTEEETIGILDLQPRSLYKLRADNTLRYSTASGRKIKYLKTDVEKYLSENSNLHSKKR